MSPLIISAVQVGDMDGFIEELSNVCAVKANETVSKPKSKRNIYDRLKPNQKKKLDIMFEADPTLKGFYNQTQITFPEPRNFDKLNQHKLNARIKELKEDKAFQARKLEIKNASKYKPDKKKVEPLVKIFTNKLDGSYNLSFSIKEINNTITAMIDTGSRVDLSNDSSAAKHLQFIQRRSIAFPALSVTGNETFRLQKYISFTILDPQNPNPVNREFKVKFYVVPNCSYDFIIGRVTAHRLGFRFIRQRDVLAFIHHSNPNSNIVYKELFESINYPISKTEEVLEVAAAIDAKEKYINYEPFVNPEAEKLMHSALVEFADVFSQNGEIGAHPELMDIKLMEGWIGFHDVPYTMNYKLREKMIEEVKSFEAKGIIEKVPPNSHLPILSTGFMVEEGHKEYLEDGSSKSGKPRLVVNLKWLNLWSEKDNHPLPLIEDILVSLNGYTRFFCLDIIKSFYHIVLTEHASLLTAFHTPIGKYKFLRCPNGINNGPPNLQRRLEELLGDLRDLKVYIDDLLGGAKGEEPEAELKLVELFIEVLKRLRSKVIKLKIQKCFMNMKILEYLGRIISAKGIEVANKHKSTILKAQTPKGKSDLETFLGLLNMLYSQVPNLALYTSFFSDIRKKNAPFHWDEKHQAIFELIKDQMRKLPVLFHPDLSMNGGRFWVLNDASHNCIGGCLMQEREKQLVPIGFHSRMLQGAEKNWHIFEQELEALCDNSRKWYKILLMKPFVHVTDHENLMDVINWCQNINHKNHNHRLHRQLLCLGEFDFILLYQPGIEFLLIIPDYLSRCIDHERIQGRIERNDGFKGSQFPNQQYDYNQDKEYFDDFNKQHFNEFIKKVKIRNHQTGKEITDFEEFKSLQAQEKRSNPWSFSALTDHHHAGYLVD